MLAYEGLWGVGSDSDGVGRVGVHCHDDMIVAVCEEPGLCLPPGLLMALLMVVAV